MADSDRQRSLSLVIVVGLIYFVVTITSGALAGAAASEQMRFFWRLSAFIISGVVFAAHIAHEHFRIHNPPRQTAFRTSGAVALGTFALAIAANIHDLGSVSGYRPRMLIALVAWPLLTGVPAFVVALAVSAGLGLKRLRV